VNGEIEAPILIIDRINSDLERVLKRTKKLLTQLCSSIPYKGFPSLRSRYFEHKKWVKIIPRVTL
jgi:ribonuclease G